jgi:hypothetical protein
MSVSNRLDDGKSEAVSIGLSDTLAADLLERLEESLHLGWWYHRGRCW